MGYAMMTTVYRAVAVCVATPQVAASQMAVGLPPLQPLEFQTLTDAQFENMTNAAFAAMF